MNKLGCDKSKNIKMPIRANIGQFGIKTFIIGKSHKCIDSHFDHIFDT